MKLGIVGLPNVGKSTLFNSLTKAGAESANYPFCTIDPNVGVVTVPDERLNVLGEMYHTKEDHSGGNRICGYCGSCKRSLQRRGTWQPVPRKYP